MYMRKAIAVCTALAALSACTQPNGAPNTGILNGGGFNKQDVGTLGGAAAGGLLGNQIGGGAGRAVATVGGVLLGGLIGNQIGKSLDNADQAAYNQKTQAALENNQPGESMPWQGKNGATGSVTPGAITQNSSGQYCREFTQTINVGGQNTKGYGTACRQPDGTWQIVSQNN